MFFLKFESKSFNNDALIWELRPLISVLPHFLCWIGNSLSRYFSTGHRSTTATIALLRLEEKLFFSFLFCRKKGNFYFGKTFFFHARKSCFYHADIFCVCRVKTNPVFLQLNPFFMRGAFLFWCFLTISWIMIKQLIFL